jgi:hypothetical protein
MPTTASINAIDIKNTYTGTLAVGSGKTLTINTDLSVAGGTFTGGGTLTFSTANLHVSGGTFNANGSAFSPTNLDVSGGTMTAGAGNLTIGGAYTQSGGAASMSGTTNVTDASMVTGGTLTKSGAGKTATFSGGLALRGTGALSFTQGTLTINTLMSMAGSSTFTGASGTTATFADFDMTGGTMTTASTGVTINDNVAISGGTYNNTGTTTTYIASTSTLSLSGTAAVNVTGGTMRVSRAVTLAGAAAYTSATGATNTFETTLDVNGGTFTLGGGAITVTQGVTIDGGSYSGAGTNDFNSTLDVDSGTFDASGGGVDVAGVATIAGGTYKGNGRFASTLRVQSGTFDTNGGTVSVTGAATISGGNYYGAGSSTFQSTLGVSGGTFDTNGGTVSVTNGVTVNGGAYYGTGTNTFASTLAVSSGTFDADGGSVGVAGQVTISGTGRYDSTGATSTFSRSTGTALSVTGGTIDTNGGTISVPSNAVTISGGTFQTTTGTASFGSTVTVSGTGTYDGSGGSSTAAGLVTVTGGTYKIGTSATGQTMSNGMTVSGGTLDGSSTTGVLKVAAGKTLTISGGTLQTTTGVTTGPTFDVSGAGTYFFTISSGTVSLNGGKIMGVSNTAGVNIGVNATISQLDYVDFANIPASNPGSTQYLLSINQASLSLHSTGCKFDYNPVTFSNLKTVRLTDSNTTVDVRAWFQLKNTATNGAAAGDAYDADEDTAPDDGVGDAGNKAVVYWSYTIITDTAGAIQGVPTAAFDWNTGAYYSTYAVYRDASGTTDRVYVRDANGDPVSYYDVPTANGNVVGTPLWTTESSVHVVYLGTSTGRIYRLVDTNGTLAASTGTWATHFSSGTVVSITSPLIDDGTNLYFGGTTAGAANRVFGVSKSAKTLVKNVTTAANISAAPSWKINTATSTTYLFVGSAFVTNQAYLYRINMVPTGAVDATCCGASVTSTSIGSATRLASSVLYAGDGSAKLHAIDAMNLAVGGFVNKSGWPYQDSNATRHSPVTVGAIQGAPWVDTSAGRLFYGDNDGHLYQLTTAGALVANYPIRLTTTNQLRSSPIYLSGSGVVVIGDSGGNVYYVDVKNASSAPALMYTTTLSGAVSSIAYNANTAQYMVGTASGVLEMLPVKADPTPTFVY